MVEKHESIVMNSVWEVFPRPTDISVMGLTCIFKVKEKEYGSIENSKARFMAKGYSQIEGIESEDTSAHVARYSSIRSILSLVAQIG